MKVSKNPIAADLRTPKYRKRVIERKDKKLPRKVKHKTKEMA